MSPKERLWNKAVARLARPMAADVPSPNDFDCVLGSIRPADVLLVEGRTRIGEIIEIIARSSRSRSGPCIGGLRMAQPREPKTNASASGGARRGRDERPTAPT